MSTEEARENPEHSVPPIPPVPSIPPVTHTPPQSPPPPLPPPPAPPQAIPLPRARHVQPEKKRRGCGWWILGVVAVIVFGLMLLFLFVVLGVFSSVEGSAAPGTRVGKMLVEETIEGSGNQKLLVLPVSGIIGALPSAFGEAEDTAAMVEDMLKIAEADSSIRGILLYVDSPGGGITASDVIRHDLIEFRKRTGKPIVALFGDVAASGGYYVATSADYIVAHPTTVTGSIGVIMPLYGIEGLLGKIGVESRTIKSGAMKDMGAMSVPLSPEARQLLQNMVNEYHSRFVDMVFDGMSHRGIKITREELLSHTDGRVFTGEQALKIGFVDKIGYFEDAVSAARAKAGLPADCRVVIYKKRPGLMSLLLSKSDAATSGTVTLKIDGMPRMESRFMYLWMPGETFEVRSGGEAR